ncbi:TPA: HlyD family efflux transporter periplasmic adaptor subunit [Proteus mirabilis]
MNKDNKSNYNEPMKWNGDALLINTFNSSIVYYLLVLFLCVVFYLLFFCNLSKKIELEGEIISHPKTINIYATNQGIIKKIFYHPGDLVKQGEPLLSINSSAVIKDGEETYLRSRNIQEKIRIANKIIVDQNNLSEERIHSLEQQINQYNELLIDINKIEVDINNGTYFFKKNKVEFDGYLKKGLITKEQLLNQSYNYYQQYNLYQSVLLQKNEIKTKIIDLRNRIQEIKSDNYKSDGLKRSEILDLQNKLNEIKVAEELIIPSPISGIIESVNFSIDEQIKNGNILMKVAPQKKQYEIISWVPNYVMPYLKVNDEVVIRYDAFPYEKYGQFNGNVSFISNVSASQEEISQYNLLPEQYSGSLTFYKIKISNIKQNVKLKNNNFELKNNMIAHIIIPYDSRRLYDWIFSPIYKINNAIKGVDDE